MSEVNLSTKTNPRGPTPEAQVLPKAGWKVRVIGVLLSLLFPGLGQWRNRAPWKGFLAAVTFPLLAMVAGYSRILLSFWGFVGFITLRLFLLAWICVDAFRGARRDRESRKSFHEARFVYAALGLLILTCAVFPTTDYFLHQFGYFRAFKVSSASMCRTICEGERIVADMDAYLKSSPRRGDIIMLDFHSEHGTLFIKRVVGIPGDIVSERDGVLLVNGKPMRENRLPQVCGKPKN